MADGRDGAEASSYLPPISNTWQIKQLSDFNGDGRTDILWREVESGNTYLWLMAGSEALGAGHTDFQADNTWLIHAQR